MQGVNALSSLLRTNTTLTALRADVATRNGAEVVADALVSANRTLTHLTLGGPISQGLMDVIAAQLNDNAALTEEQTPGHDGKRPTCCLVLN